jgi:hypothetical protein
VTREQLEDAISALRKEDDVSKEDYLVRPSSKKSVCDEAAFIDKDLRQMDRADKAEAELAALKLAVTEDFEFLWRNYAMEDDAKLTEDAQQLKRWLLDTFASRDELAAAKAENAAKIAELEAERDRWRNVATMYYTADAIDMNEWVKLASLKMLDMKAHDAADEAYEAVKEAQG